MNIDSYMILHIPDTKAIQKASLHVIIEAEL
jgi:hypothetical protein